jgi:glyoxylase-like metal-dependent hydrolase (beta-lactamase superfamily II)
MLEDAEANLSAGFGVPLVSPPADRLLEHGDTFEAAGIALEVRAIPGHSPGHIVFVHHASPPVVFGGDVLFQGGIGRYDFPGGNGRLLLQGIREQLLPLPDEAVVHPGHGPTTTIGRERRSNPYLRSGFTPDDD